MESFKFLHQALQVGQEAGLAQSDLVAQEQVMVGLSEWRLSRFGRRLFLLRMPKHHQTQAVRSFVNFIAEKSQSLRD